MSTDVVEESAFSSADVDDIEAAKMAASTRPTTPAGRWCITKFRNT